MAASTPAPLETPLPPPVDPQIKFQNTPMFVSILGELDINKAQTDKRQALIRDIEEQLSSRYDAPNRMISYVLRFGHARAQMSSADVTGLETVLNSVSGAQQINVLLHSPGGDGTIVEKMVDMCRGHLVGDQQKLRVIVPNIAKSAATLFALGADTITMGYLSELGPIDPQLQVAVSGVIHWVSALAFVESRDKLMREIAEATAKKEPTIGLLQPLGCSKVYVSAKNTGGG